MARQRPEGQLLDSNTGETIVWQHVLDRPRITGRNLPRFAEELDVALNDGSAFWLQRNDEIVNLLNKFLD